MLGGAASDQRRHARRVAVGEAERLVQRESSAAAGRPMVVVRTSGTAPKANGRRVPGRRPGVRPVRPGRPARAAPTAPAASAASPGTGPPEVSRSPCSSQVTSPSSWACSVSVAASTKRWNSCAQASTAAWTFLSPLKKSGFAVECLEPSWGAKPSRSGRLRSTDAKAGRGPSAAS